MEDIIEEIAEDVHRGWMEEKQRQGFADHTHRYVRQGYGLMQGDCRPQCTISDTYHHPDMLPYAKLAENVKEYDRATARAVWSGLLRRGYRIYSPDGVIRYVDKD